ncbi:Cation-chloride cotransporter [Paratrimastix pyriformis]|uniref:Cation-chloride cotransporter n=1 Tax=Paratrimastix pyriformis TaxID=342808 RepID=A0ABQ8U6Q1_9EUKA|nr:Cation-chloride cotransporter [Paratrimastix pyriformis]
MADLREESSPLLSPTLPSSTHGPAEKRRKFGFCTNMFGKSSGKLGVLSGVFILVFEKLINVAFWERFAFCLGEAGLLQTLSAVAIASAAVILTTVNLGAIVSNGEVRIGGVYYVISRTLGVELGGALGVLIFFALIFGSALNILGVFALFKTYIPAVAAWSWWPSTGISTAITALCLFIVLGGASIFAKATNLIFVTIIGALLCIWGMLAFQGPRPDVGFVSWSWDTFRDNLWAHYDSKTDYLFVFGIMLPAFTNILGGLNMSGDLKNPSRDIPRGTLWAIYSIVGVYVMTIVLLAATTPSDVLTHGYFVLADLTFPYVVLVGIGIASLAGPSRVPAPHVSKDRLFPLMGWIAPRPRTKATPLQVHSLPGSFSPSLAPSPPTSPASPAFSPAPMNLGTTESSHRVEPDAEDLYEPDAAGGLTPPAPVKLGEGNDYNPPLWISVLLTAAVIEVLIVIGNVDVVAQFNGMLNMQTYLLVNYSALVHFLIGSVRTIDALWVTNLDAASRPFANGFAGVTGFRDRVPCSAPGWRPTFRWANKTTAFLGCVTTAASMILVDPFKAGISLLIMIAIVLYLSFSQRGKVQSWGHVSQSFEFHQARARLLSLDESKRHVKYWRPNLMIFCPGSASMLRIGSSALQPKEVARRDPFRQTLALCNDLKKGGLLVLAHVVVAPNVGKEGFGAPLFVRIKRAQTALTHAISRFRLKAFPSVVAAPDFRMGVQSLVLGQGIGAVMRPNTCVLRYYDMALHPQRGATAAAAASATDTSPSMSVLSGSNPVPGAEASEPLPPSLVPDLPASFVGSPHPDLLGESYASSASVAATMSPATATAPVDLLHSAISTPAASTVMPRPATSTPPTPTESFFSGPLRVTQPVPSRPSRLAASTYVGALRDICLAGNALLMTRHFEQLNAPQQAPSIFGRLRRCFGRRSATRSRSDSMAGALPPLGAVDEAEAPLYIDVWVNRINAHPLGSPDNNSHSGGAGASEEPALDPTSTMALLLGHILQRNPRFSHLRLRAMVAVRNPEDQERETAQLRRLLHSLRLNAIPHVVPLRLSPAHPSAASLLGEPCASWGAVDVPHLNFTIRSASSHTALLFLALDPYGNPLMFTGGGPLQSDMFAAGALTNPTGMPGPVHGPASSEEAYLAMVGALTDSMPATLLFHASETVVTKDL